MLFGSNEEKWNHFERNGRYQINPESATDIVNCNQFGIGDFVACVNVLIGCSKGQDDIQDEEAIDNMIAYLSICCLEEIGFKGDFNWKGDAVPDGQEDDEPFPFYSIGVVLHYQPFFRGSAVVVLCV